MGINKIFIYILTGIILSGCAQSTAMIGPAITLASSGNVSQARINLFYKQSCRKRNWNGYSFNMFLRKLNNKILK